MQTSINLQGLYRYSVIPVLIFFIIFMIMTIYLIVKRAEKSSITKNKPRTKVIPEKNVKNIPAIKSKYLGKLNEVEDRYRNKKISLRRAYQQISEDVRYFVFEVTDITTQNFSLSEIKQVNIPGLYEVIEEYYEPEFASKSVGDFDNAINKARRIVNEWN
ncbi:MAG: hypothetical protein IJH12_06625 [Clostridia bacterium]|nr:hypothetical protein [Clostridia bacterium]